MANSKELITPPSASATAAGAIPGNEPLGRHNAHPLRLAALALLVVGLALVIAVLPTTTAIAVVIGLGVAVLIFIRIDIGLWLLAFAVPFSSVRPIGLGGLNLTATDFLVALVLVSWLVRGLTRRELRLPSTSILITLVGFFTVLLFTTTTAISLDATLKELLRWLELIIVYVVVSDQIRGRRQVWALVSFLLAAASVEALVGWYQFLAKAGPESFIIGRFLRAYGTFSQPNPFGGYLGLVLPVALCLAMASLVILHQQRSRLPAVRDGFAFPAVSRGEGGLLSNARWQRITYLLAWGACGLIGAAMVMSMSRGALLGAAMAIFVIAALASRRTLGLAVLAIVVVAIVLMLGTANVLPAQIGDRLTQMIQYFGVFDARHIQANSENWAIVERMAHWQAAWDMFMDQPLFGVGIGNFAVAYQTYAVPGWPEALGHAHNFYLNMLAEAGLVGGVAYLVMVATWFWHGVGVIKRVKRSCDILNLAIVLGLIGVLTAGTVHNLFDNLYVHDMNVHIGLTLGLLTAVGARSVSAEKRGNE